ncbi:molybdenum cofactor biosynthesis protein MoaE [Neisseria sp. Ec49-e6-T10]|uniref:molybdenum cofactor biosynthesis protein MoaE n=1 Tax=Neisseria sp. Ec49-e6-T10 TaxID=3140744 RepID=UPI003EC0FA79
MFNVIIQTEPFSLAQEEQKLNTQEQDCGALVIFQGMVRGKDGQKDLSQLYLEHYPEVTEKEIQRIINLAKERWAIKLCHIIHRVGHLSVGEPIVLIITAAAHRKDAFAANEFIMDFLKTEAPFWKKECFVNGQDKWVEAKASDTQAKKRWDTP